MVSKKLSILLDKYNFRYDKESYPRSYHNEFFRSLNPQLTFADIDSKLNNNIDLKHHDLYLTAGSIVFFMKYKSYEFAALMKNKDITQLVFFILKNTNFKKNGY